MRTVELTIPAEREAGVRGALEDAGVWYAASGPLDGPGGADLVTVSFHAPVNAVEPILDRLWDRGIEDGDASVVVSAAETVVSDRADALRSRYSSGAETGTRIAREELLARARDLVPGLRAYAVLLVLSVVIAVAGLLANSAAVVVGSMVVAPLLGPALSASVGTVVDDRDLFARGVRMQVGGALVAVAVAAGFASLVRAVHLVPAGDVLAIGEISSRTAPDLLALVVAIAAGAAGAYSLSSGAPTTLVGVAVAAVLVPPLGVVGIGLAWGSPMVAAGALVLVAVNLLAINLVAVAVFSVQGYRPRESAAVDDARATTRRRLAALAVSLLVLSTFLGVVTLGEVRAAATEEAVRSDVADVLADPAYADVGLVEVAFVDDGSLPVAQPDRVLVTVGHPPGEAHPNLLEDLREAVDDSLAVDLEVELQA